MNPKTVLSFICGCAVGGLVVAFGLRDRAASAPASPPLAVAREPATPEQTGASRLAAPPTQSPGVEAARVESPVKRLPADGSRAELGIPGYDFSHVTNSRQQVEEIFAAERVDPVWSPQAVDTLNLVLSGMPERSVIGDYGLTCKASLCKLEIKGTVEQLASAKPENNVQPAIMGLVAHPPASEMFDDSMMQVDMGKDDIVTLTLYAHRRAAK
jgi:hypothetical protein